MLTTNFMDTTNMSQIIFEVSKDEIDGGYSASAVGYGIHTQADTLDELRRNIREAIDCHFDNGIEDRTPHIILT